MKIQKAFGWSSFIAEHARVDGLFRRELAAAMVDVRAALPRAPQWLTVSTLDLGDFGTTHYKITATL